MPNPREARQSGGDQIKIGDISGSQGIAIGRQAQAKVEGSVMSGGATIDPDALRAGLRDLRTALGTANLPDDAMDRAQAAVSNALVDGLHDNKVNPEAVAANVQKVGDVLKQANIAVNQGSTLWQSIRNLAPILGPIVRGGAPVVAGWLGVQLPG